MAVYYENELKSSNTLSGRIFHFLNVQVYAQNLPSAIPWRPGILNSPLYSRVKWPQRDSKQSVPKAVIADHIFYHNFRFDRE